MSSKRTNSLLNYFCKKQTNDKIDEKFRKQEEKFNKLDENFRKQEETSKPVSYTHLDVYKRQVLNFYLFKKCK